MLEIALYHLNIHRVFLCMLYISDFPATGKSSDRSWGEEGAWPEAGTLEGGKLIAHIKGEKLGKQI